MANKIGIMKNLSQFFAKVFLKKQETKQEPKYTEKKTLGIKTKLNNAQRIAQKRGVYVRMVYDIDRNYAKDKNGRYKYMPALRVGNNYLADRRVLQ